MLTSTLLPILGAASESTIDLPLVVVFIIYILATFYLGWVGFKKTKSATDYLLAGRKTHPVVMALSYGSTFISTSAIVGFGGVAAVYGMGLLWLTFLNIFFGIFIAFVFFGKRTRQLGHRLDAHTFPELLGRRFNSRFIQGSSAAIIFIFMPLYAAAVLIGGAKFLVEQLHIGYEQALAVLSIIIAIYVIMGGIKGVMYTDALQGAIMLVGMVILIIFTYTRFGGIIDAHQALTNIADKVPPKLVAGGHQGWTAMPLFGSPIWWTLVSTIVMGVGIGVLAQPQLTVRYMTVKSAKELNRAVPIGGVFILCMTGVAFVVGALTNLYFLGLDPLTNPEIGGKISIAAAKGDVEKIIPMFITQALPHWFGILFMLTLLSAAMSTISSQFHTMGTALGRDLVEQAICKGRNLGGSGILVSRLGVIVGILVSVALGFWLEQKFGKTGTEIVARGTAIFFGLCACSFLPMYIGALWIKGITKAGAIAGMFTGALVSLLWMLFVHEKISTSLNLCKSVFGVRSLGVYLVDGVEKFHKAGPFVWSFVDPMIIGLPLAALVTIVVSMLTPKPSPDLVSRCFSGK